MADPMTASELHLKGGERFFISQDAGAGGVPPAARGQPHMTRVELEAAIKTVTRCATGWDGEYQEDLQKVIDAAWAHWGTLPQVRKVKVWIAILPDGRVNVTEDAGTASIWRTSFGMKVSEREVEVEV